MLKKLLSTGIALVASANFAMSASLEDMSWDEIVAQAKSEGELTWFIWYFQDEFRDVAKAFTAETGIKVSIPEGTAAGNIDKLIAEKDRETGDIDVIAFGYENVDIWPLGTLFQKIDGALPDVSGRTQDVTGIKGEGYVFAYWGNQTGIAYDPDMVAKADLPQTPEDFAAFWTTNPEKFGFNYVKGGSGPSFFHNTLRVVSGIDYFGDTPVDEKLAGIQPGIDFFNDNAENYVITASNIDSINRVSDRELWMVPAWEDHLAGLQNRGEVRKEIAYYIPEMGMSGGGNGVAIPQNAPNPAAALVFIDWLTSANVQAGFNARFGTAPMHADADDSKALVPNSQRAFSQAWPGQPFKQRVEDTFIEEVVLNR
jgi:putative spermidine/putrescine transport system substrate-binding protein